MFLYFFCAGLYVAHLEPLPIFFHSFSTTLSLSLYISSSLLLSLHLFFSLFISLSFSLSFTLSFSLSSSLILSHSLSLSLSPSLSLLLSQCFSVFVLSKTPSQQSCPSHLLLNPFQHLSLSLIFTRGNATALGLSMCVLLHSFITSSFVLQNFSLSCVIGRNSTTSTRIPFPRSR